MPFLSADDKILLWLRKIRRSGLQPLRCLFQNHWRILSTAIWCSVLAVASPMIKGAIEGLALERRIDTASSVGYDPQRTTHRAFYPEKGMCVHQYSLQRSRSIARRNFGAAG